MKLNISCMGHAVAVALEGTGPVLAGKITSTEYGEGLVRAKKDGGELKGVVNLDGYEANFEAAIAGSQVHGELRYGWFFRAKFSGTVEA